MKETRTTALLHHWRQLSGGMKLDTEFVEQLAAKANADSTAAVIK